MTSFTPDEISAAMKAMGVAESLRNGVRVQLELRHDHSHDFADDDMISVKEIREAWERQFTGKDGGVFAEAHRIACAGFLRDISEHREPEYPYATVWKDGNGVIWFRASGNLWMCFGSSERFPHDRPARPLRQMDVI